MAHDETPLFVEYAGQDAVSDAMYLEELAYEAEQEAIADAMFFEELAYEAELACF